jgi:hypothetical protein
MKSPPARGEKQVLGRAGVSGTFIKLHLFEPFRPIQK